jgi:hypothetical protein
MQYFKPAADALNVGDCIPFFHDGIFHLFYLLDEGHHHAKGGLGAHQWAHASTTDLVHWEHHPLAIPLTDDRECSICTGSVFTHEGLYRAYYATRLADWSEHLSLAVSTDGARFEKTEPNPFASPGPETTRSYRDPHVFRDPDTGLFHLLVTTALRDYAAHDRGGCLGHLVSRDLETWQAAEPFLLPGYHGDPECPDTFEWHGWYYLIFSNDGVARYRMSRRPLGPWLRPAVDTFDGPMARVLKTAAFTGDRRLGVAFLPVLEGDRDDGGWLYGGNAVFREIIQHEDGTLGTRFPAEMIPASGAPLDLPFEPLTDGLSRAGRDVAIDALTGFRVGAFTGVPLNCRITARVNPRPNASYFGLCLRGSGGCEQGYELRLSARDRKAEIASPLARTTDANPGRSIGNVEGLDRPFTLDVIARDTLIDVCLDHRRCLVSRCPEQRGDRLFVFAQNAEVTFEALEVRPLA